jgi:ABC-type proline/glycine betaine transport system permease subunit
MATLPAFLRKAGGPEARGPVPVRAERDPFQLRALPHEDVYFYCKKIDNTRLVREADPQARGACWSTIGVAFAILALLTGALVPSVANTVAGYRLEDLRAEERRLVDERRGLELQEAELLSPASLDRYAKERDLTAPSPDQLVRLDGKGEGAVAMVKK